MSLWTRLVQTRHDTFKVCKSVHHRTIQINHQPDATIFQFIILSFIYSSTCFGRSHAHHQELNDCSSSLWFYIRIVVIAVLCLWSGRSLPARPQTKHGYHHDTKVKPEAATAVIELLMMGGRTPETCWAVNKRQDNKLENCCIRLVIYLNWNAQYIPHIEWYPTTAPVFTSGKIHREPLWHNHCNNTVVTVSSWKPN